MVRVVQPGHRQLLLLQRLARLDDLAGEAAGEPLGVPVGVVEIAEHERRVTHEVQRQQPTSCPAGTERGDGARVEVDDPRSARLGRALDEALAGALGRDDAEAAAAPARSGRRWRRSAFSSHHDPR